MPKANLPRYVVLLATCFIATPAFYVLTVCFRVGCAEQELFGRSYTFPLTLTCRQYTDPPSLDSCGSITYRFCRNGQSIIVYKQLINGFQHAYGSALVALELGRKPSDLLFRLNEYGEAYLRKDGGTFYHYLDTKKDLHNNEIGRTIGHEARKLHLSGESANKFIVERILIAMNSGEVINHCFNARVSALPSPEHYNCPGLPKPKSDPR